MATVVTRLAPSPTGAQHLGNARTYLIAWLSARSQNGRVVLRIEDIDSPRVKAGAIESVCDDLRWLAEKFLSDGKRVAILSRGYRGANGTSDEIELMKFRLRGRVLFGVGRDRFAEGHRLETQQAIDVFLLDDGFQHLQLARDLNILLMDASRPLAGELLLPAGRLREPVAAMSRANLIIFTRAETASGTLEAIGKQLAVDKEPNHRTGLKIAFRHASGRERVSAALKWADRRRSRVGSPQDSIKRWKGTCLIAELTPLISV